MTNWRLHWLNSEYVKQKQEHFLAIDNYLKAPVQSIMDIGCGYAQESIAFNQKYNSKLVLLEGDNTTGARDSGWNSDPNNFAFYNSLDELEKYFENKKIKNYKLFDIKTYNSNKTFDLICSYLSCGFHYPIETYEQLIKKSMHKNTKLIFTLRKKRVKHNCKIKNIIYEAPKYITAEIEL